MSVRYLRLWVLLFATHALFLAAGIAVGRDIDQPTCPTEDSCTVDYRNGHYVIEETTP